LLNNCKNILVLSGAGISVNSGIPDFRSKNGIYNRLDEYDLEDPSEMFDIEFFRYNPVPFYKFAKVMSCRILSKYFLHHLSLQEIYPVDPKPSVSHSFINLIEQKGKLLRNYTQNIDNLEKLAGIKNVLQCHGNLGYVYSNSTLTTHSRIICFCILY
jgi:NAD-dependent SIR2 family protein deacetylase